MQTVTNSSEIRQCQGFETYVLRNDRVEIAVVPELGARILSLKNNQTGREWMWHPESELKLFRNALGDDFSRSTLAGADECLPTIAPCLWQQRQLPDHGEVWSAAWQVDSSAWARGFLRTSVKLAVSPLEFERTIEVRGHEIWLRYLLTNQAGAEEQYLWAFHPLLRVQPEDRLELPGGTRALLDGVTWLESVGSTIPDNGCAKTFAGPLQEGYAAVYNRHSADRLIFEWNPAQNDTLGLWLTRGGWHGHHHLAIEPTKGAPDPLALAAERKRCGIIPASGSVAWTICLRVEP